MIRCYLRDDGLGAVGIRDVSALVLDTGAKRSWRAGDASHHSVPDYDRDREIHIAKFLEMSDGCMPASVDAKDLLDRVQTWHAAGVAASSLSAANFTDCEVVPAEDGSAGAWDAAQKDEDDAKLFLQHLVRAKTHGLSLEFTMSFLADYKACGDVTKAIAHANREWDIA